MAAMDGYVVALVLHVILSALCDWTSGVRIVTQVSCEYYEKEQVVKVLHACYGMVGQINTRILQQLSDDSTPICSGFQDYTDCMAKTFVCSGLDTEYRKLHNLYTGAPYYCNLSDNTLLPEPLQTKYLNVRLHTQYKHTSGAAARGVTIARAAALMLTLYICIFFTTS